MASLSQASKADGSNKISRAPPQRHDYYSTKRCEKQFSYTCLAGRYSFLNFNLERIFCATFSPHFVPFSTDPL